ncbi:hypothetical protein ACOKFD_07115 [Flagellimonas sp. S174]|uniref:hypothetical protein n=1 Tax=Flagellimonas sp. S174 TaxID=3410790 RepID=UPI003BF4A354
MTTQELLILLKDFFFIPVYLVTLIVSMFNYRKFFDTALRHFPLLIAYTFFNELLGGFIRYNESFAFFPKLTSTNQIIYNIYILIFFLYFYSVFRKVIKNEKIKQLIKWGSILVVICYLGNSFFQNPFNVDLIYANAIGSWLLVACGIYYLKNLNPPFAWKLDKRNLMFWTTISLVIFYLFFPILFLIGYLHFETWVMYELKMVLKILITLMYLLFCIGFIVSRRNAFR